MNFSIISGSHRPSSNSAKVADYIRRTLTNMEPESTTDLVSLANNEIPLWDESIYQADSKLACLWKNFSQRLHVADALVVITPEWGGMVTPGLKNFLLMCANGELSHKPALIVSVSAGDGGSYPVAELRSSGYKNNHVCFIPEHVIIRHADHMLNNMDKADSSLDEYVRSRLFYALGLLTSYADALALVRVSGKVDDHNFPYGM